MSLWCDESTPAVLQSDMKHLRHVIPQKRSKVRSSWITRFACTPYQCAHVACCSVVNLALLIYGQQQHGEYCTML